MVDEGAMLTSDQLTPCRQPDCLVLAAMMLLSCHDGVVKRSPSLDDSGLALWRNGGLCFQCRCALLGSARHHVPSTRGLRSGNHLVPAWWKRKDRFIVLKESSLES